MSNYQINRQRARRNLYPDCDESDCSPPGFYFANKKRAIQLHLKRP